MIGSLLLVLSAVASNATGSGDAGAWDCDEAITQQDMNACAHQQYLAADRTLNIAWLQAAQKTKQADRYIEEIGHSDGRPGHFETLLEAQRAWLRFRDNQCTVEGYAARGGSMEPLLYSICMTRMTEERTRDLRALVETSE